MNYDQKTPCAECPFRKASVRGWLGRDTGDAENLINSILGLHPVGPNAFAGKEPEHFACHMDTHRVIEAHEKATDEACYGEVPDGLTDRVQHCVGALLMLKARCKRPHDRIKSMAMDVARSTEPMITNREEFIAHHTLKPKRKK